MDKMDDHHLLLQLLLRFVVVSPTAMMYDGTVFVSDGKFFNLCLKLDLCCYFALEF